MRRLVAAFAVVAAVGLSTVGPQAHAMTDPTANPTDSFQQANFATATYGDFTEVGNGVLRCPNDTDPPAGGGTPAQCEAATAGQTGVENSSFYLRRAGSNGADVFDSSTAQLSVPSGATVEYAQLGWGGSTGRSGIDIALSLGDGPLVAGSVTLPPVSCTGLYLPTLLPTLLAPAEKPPSPPAAPTPDRQNLALSVRPAGSTETGTTTPVEPTNYGTAGENAQMYSAYADVTSSIAGAVTSAATSAGMPTTLDVTVGNVWAVSGFGCSAGWSLLVVFGYPTAPTDPASPYQHLREVDVYTNRLVQEPLTSNDLAVPASNVDANRAGVEVGLTAFGGDPEHSGEVSVGGQVQADPCGAPDFFSGCAQGALDPLDPNTFVKDNLSVDAKSIVPATASVTGGPDVDIGLSGTSRPYLLQNIVISEDIDPSIGVSMAGPGQPVHAGDPATVTVLVRNTGDVPLYGVGLTVGPAATGPKCQPDVAGTLAPGDMVNVRCTLTAADSTFDATATATGDYRLDDPHTQVSGTATTTVTVIGPLIAVAVSANPPVVRKTDPGQPVLLTFTVTNDSPAAEGPLDATVTPDPALPGCQPAPIDQIQPGFTGQATCTIMPITDTTVTATAIATSQTYPHDKATATSSKVGIGVVNPALDIVVLADPTTVAPNGQVSFTVAVHNTGNVALALTATDDIAQACDFTVTGTGLAPNSAQSQKCTLPVPSGATSLTDTAHFSATPVGRTTTGIPITGPAASDPITGQASGTATVSALGSATGSGGAAAGGSGGSSGTGAPGGGSGSGGSGAAAGGGSSGSSPSLAYTGVAVGVPLALGAGLVVLGLVLVSRRRRRQ
jgi:archaellum component FlaG (FlaF/FlaG flagellin family)